ncbi:hypothetical protein NQZ68_002729 [Dissostichus eleginoides]|nr:hypothetical protein NQZ68_002729 [Dissostichus eleginoides]
MEGPRLRNGFQRVQRMRERAISTPRPEATQNQTLTLMLSRAGMQRFASALAFRHLPGTWLDNPQACKNLGRGAPQSSPPVRSPVSSIPILSGNIATSADIVHEWPTLSDPKAQRRSPNRRRVIWTYLNVWKDNPRGIWTPDGGEVLMFGLGLGPHCKVSYLDRQPLICTHIKVLE